MNKEKRKPRGTDAAGWFIKAMLAGVILVFVVGCGTSIWFMILMGQRSQERAANCERLMAQPVPYQVTGDLCKRGLMPPEISDCRSAIETRYMHDIVQANVEIGVSTFDDVNSMFGQYAGFCDDVNAVRQDASLSTFSCYYQPAIASRQATRIHFDNNTQVVTGIRVSPCHSGS